MRRLAIARSLPRLEILAAIAALWAPATALGGGDLPIQDNSFLLEEAYNQEQGVIQHISAFNRSTTTGVWGYSFTEEWPVLGQTHQASATFNVADLRAGPGTRGLGDVLLNYRWQAVGSGEAPVAFAPRLTVVLPSGNAKRGLGAGGVGVEANLPLSVVLSERLVSHVNLGGRYIPSADTEQGSAELATFSIGQSLIWLAHRKVNLMVELAYSSTELAARSGHARFESLTVNPGLRAAIDVAGLQVVPGLAVPIGLGPSRGEKGLFLYLSFEHPFGPAGPTAEEAADRAAAQGEAALATSEK